MDFEATRGQAEESLLDRASPWVLLLALFGIPAAGCVALLLLVQIPQFLNGQLGLLLFAAEIACLIILFVLVIVLRACLALPSAPRGFYRDVLDFLALARWHPAIKAALIALLVLPPVWYIHGSPGFIQLLQILGWRVLSSGDFRDGLQGIAVSWQLALVGGVPLLFALHMLSRWKPKNRFLPWLLLPLLFIGTAIGVVLIVAIVHH